MLDHPAVVVPVTIAIIALSAFFVAIEFALLAARRHRLEEAAPQSRSARAALRSSSELTVLLAGSQLGITACTLALGAITKPAVHHWLMIPLEGLGLPKVAGDIISFVLALLVVTFLHLVVGEMAPKSWAIAHPEASATLLALPMRAFMWVTRPLLVALNSSANWLLRRCGVEPTNEIANGQTSDDLQQLVRHSANVGALDARFTAQVTGVLELERLTVADLVDEADPPVAVTVDDTVARVREVATSSGHLRILLSDGGRLTGLVHVRDVLTAGADEPLAPYARPLLVLDPELPVYQAVAQLRETRNQLAVVGTGEAPLGVITVADILQRVLVVG
ncbi:MAG TPA: HlyC/CorC family transporter [Candidatus Avipropionibacterium avicola]|uniref:HlyC/CorC family transporter n=1 Tax=Candidatus Avipropionibacterium avicola TaxID=2840701 RepID=A0A9D1KNI0_9ACTN|nr:HlyC/CorC family transporter [Candidatus Avipropionibacterium avicola]